MLVGKLLNKSHVKGKIVKPLADIYFLLQQYSNSKLVMVGRIG
jgi:hypothetical protein